MKHNDIYWCLESSFLDNIDFQDILNNGLLWGQISNYFQNKLISRVDKRKIEQILCFVVTERPFSNKEFEVTLFDFLSSQYLWHMGDACRRLRGNVTPFIRGVIDYITTNKGFIESWSKRYYSQFTKVPKILSQNAFVIITNLRYEYELINDEEYKQYLSAYCLPTHVDYEELIAPDIHLFKNRTIVDVIQNEDKDSIDSYFRDRYKQCPIFKTITKTDMAKFYYSHWALPLGDKSIYDTNS